MYNLNDYFKAFIGGFREKRDVWYLSLYLWFKGKKYRERRLEAMSKRRDKLLSRAIRDSCNIMSQSTIAKIKFMQFVKPEHKFSGGKFHVPKT